MMVKTNLHGLKKMTSDSSESAKSEAGGGEKGKQWTYSPVWLPVQTEGRPVVKVTTRQEFVNAQLGDWRTIQTTRAGAILAGIGALYFLSSNVLIAAALALIAGWSWGIYTKKAFFFEGVNRRREILEGT